MTTEQKPTAFISHASADKVRFVRPFAAVLRETHGVDAWVDEWEIRPGDKFAEKIHDALAKADAVVVVLSENSVDSDWVKNEINAATVREVNEEAKLLPVVLDGLTDQRIPPVLRAIQQVRVDADDHKSAAEKINRAIRGLPNVGKPPLPPSAPDAGGGGMLGQLSRTIPPAHIPPAHKLGILLQIAESGNASAQNALGVMYHEGEGVPQNYAEAVKWFGRAAKQGDAEAQFNLGLMYGKGKGVTQDDEAAARWIRRAAEQGVVQAQFNLGISCHKGEGVPQDDGEAAKWFRRAAERGDVAAQFNLGIMYHDGKGVPQDDGEAAKWFRHAAEQGYAEAQFNLGIRYHDGRGVPQDDGEAAKWFRHAAEQGVPQAQFNLGISYHKGEGVPQDDAEAVRWFHRAAEQGMSEAVDALKRLQKGGDGKE